MLKKLHFLKIMQLGFDVVFGFPKTRLRFSDSRGGLVLLSIQFYLWLCDYYCEGYKEKSAKVKGTWGKFRGNQVQASKSPLAGESHRHT